MIDRRLAKRYRLKTPCLVAFSGRDETMTAEIIEASVRSAVLFLTDEQKIVPQEGVHGSLFVEEMEIPFFIVNVNRFSYDMPLDRPMILIGFTTQQPASFIDRLKGIKADQKSAQIIFRAKIDIYDSSYAETVLQLSVLHHVLNAAAHILFLLRWRHQAHIDRVVPPRIVSLTTTSPLKGVLEAAKDVVAVVAAAYNLLRHRKETKILKEEEVKQAQERTRQERHKTKQEKAKSTIASVDAALHEYTATSSALRARTERYRRDVELSRSEVALLREKLSAYKDAWKFAEDVFSDKSEELRILQSRLLPALLLLIEDQAGLDLSIPNLDELRKAR